MRKEILFAIVAGLIFGVLIAFGIWRANSALAPEEKITHEESIDKTISELAITIATPSDLSVVTKLPASINGITRPGEIVIISAEEEDYILNSEEDGSFSSEIDLIGGLNEIIVSVIALEGDFTSETLNLVYSTQFVPKTDQGEEEGSQATDAASQIRENVQQKIKEASSNPLSYIGTITDITENTIQISNIDDEIQQISVSQEETDFVKVTKTSTKIAFSDIAIGDYIIAMGYVNGDEVLEASRALITTELEENKLGLVTGLVTQAERNELVIKTLNTNEEFTVEPIRNVNVTALSDNEIIASIFSDIEGGSKIVVSGELDGNTIEARSIHILTIPEISDEGEI